MEHIKSFKQLGIDLDQLAGKKIEINKVLNKEVMITDHRIDPSKYPNEGNGLRLTLQIFLDEELRIIFTSSVVLQNQIAKVLKTDFPFKATITPLSPRGYKFT